MKGSPVLDFPIITICGSMRFYAEMLLEAERLTSEGYIVLMPFVTKGELPEGADALTPADLDAMHRVKINLCSEILVITGGTGYVGESTRGEIEYAARGGKAIRWDAIKGAGQ